MQNYSNDLPAKNLKRITTYVQPEVYEILDNWANADSRTLSNLANIILAKAAQEYSGNQPSSASEKK